MTGCKVRQPMDIFCDTGMVKKNALLVWVFAVAFFASSPVAANSFESAQEAFDDGRFLEVVEMAEALNTVEALTLATASLVILRLLCRRRRGSATALRTCHGTRRKGSQP